MSSFTWQSLKAETLRAVCRDLGAGPAIKRKRDDMISFLKDVDNLGCVLYLMDAITPTSEFGVISSSSRVITGK